MNMRHLVEYSASLRGPEQRRAAAEAAAGWISVSKQPGLGSYRYLTHTKELSGQKNC